MGRQLVQVDGPCTRGKLDQRQQYHSQVIRGCGGRGYVDFVDMSLYRYVAMSISHYPIASTMYPVFGWYPPSILLHTYYLSTRLGGQCR